MRGGTIQPKEAADGKIRAFKALCPELRCPKRHSSQETPLGFVPLFRRPDEGWSFTLPMDSSCRRASPAHSDRLVFRESHSFQTLRPTLLIHCCVSGKQINGSSSPQK